MNLGERSFLFRTPSYQLIFDIFNWYLISILCVYGRQTFPLVLCAIMKSVESAWYTCYYLALFWELVFSFLENVSYLPKWEKTFENYSHFYLICSLGLPWYLQLVLIGIRHLIHRYLFQLVSLMGALIPCLLFFFLLDIFQVISFLVPSLLVGILFSIVSYLTSCVDVFLGSIICCCWFLLNHVLFWILI